MTSGVSATGLAALLALAGIASDRTRRATKTSSIDGCSRALKPARIQSAATNPSATTSATTMTSATRFGRMFYPAQNLPRDPGIELLFFLQLCRDRLSVAPGLELPDPHAKHRRRPARGGEHVRGVAFRLETLGDCIGLVAIVECRDLQGVTLAAGLSRR